MDQRCRQKTECGQRHVYIWCRVEVSIQNGQYAAVENYGRPVERLNPMHQRRRGALTAWCDRGGCHLQLWMTTSYAVDLVNRVGADDTLGSALLLAAAVLLVLPSMLAYLVVCAHRCCWTVL